MKIGTEVYYNNYELARIPEVKSRATLSNKYLQKSLVQLCGKLGERFATIEVLVAIQFS